MNQDSMQKSIKSNQPNPTAVIASALITLTLLLGACGGSPEPTATPVPLPTPIATIAEPTTEAVTANGALTETEQAAQTSGITEGTAPSGTANAVVITSTQLVTGTEVVTSINVSTNTAVIEQSLITTVITNTNMVSNVVQSADSSSATESSVTTETSKLTPESSTGQADVNVTITPLSPTPTSVVSNTLEGTATPQPTETPQSSEGQMLTGTTPVAVGTIFTGVTDAEGKTSLPRHC